MRCILSLPVTLLPTPAFSNQPLLKGNMWGGVVGADSDNNRATTRTLIAGGIIYLISTSGLNVNVVYIPILFNGETV